MRTHALLRCSVLALILVAGTYAPAQAQGYVSPFIGVFSGDANCPSISKLVAVKRFPMSNGPVAFTSWARARICFANGSSVFTSMAM